MPGVSTGARTSFEKAVLDRQKELAAKLGKKDYVITPEEYNKLAVEFFGNIEDKLPAGAKVIQSSPLEVTYELDGKQYKAVRNTDSNLGIDTGRIETQLLSSPINAQSAAGEQDLLKDLLPKLFNQAGQSQTGSADISGWLSKLGANADELANQKGLVPIDPQTQALLDTITQAKNSQLQNQFGQAQESLIANLFGRGINKSNLAGQEANRLLQGQGLVQEQANADSAQRQLSVAQILTQLFQGNKALAGEQYTSGAQQSLSGYNAETGRFGQNLNFVTNLLNEALTRETAGVSLGQGQQQINNQQTQFDKNYGLAQQQFEAQAAAQRHAQRLATINSIIGAVTGVGSSLFSAFGTGGAKTGGAHDGVS